MNKEELRDLLEHLHDKYNRPEFIEPDPISIPHSFSDRHDREVAGFMAATIAWGNRKAIVKSAARMMQYMDYSPADFVRNASASELAHLQSYVHRTSSGRYNADIGIFFHSPKSTPRSSWRTNHLRYILSRLQAAPLSIDERCFSQWGLCSIEKNSLRNSDNTCGMLCVAT